MNRLFTRIDYDLMGASLADQVVGVDIVQREREGTVRLSAHLGWVGMLQLPA